MPTCPGCQQHVSYAQLDTHERYCAALGRSDDTDRQSIRRLESRVDDVQRQLDGRIQALEARIGTGVDSNNDGATSRLVERDW